MPNEFLNISEATLWDNLKRKANETLKKISSEETGAKRLDFFKPDVDSKTIPKLLEDIGKQFYKLFLCHHITKQLEVNSESDIEQLLYNFRFYFWPGYTTLEDKRIFINGSKRSETKTQRFFTGIGNNPENVFSKNYREELPNFLLSKNHIASFGGSNSTFWIGDIPSTIAFDNILNQKYLKSDLQNAEYNVASTHFWKSSQKIRNKKGKYEFIPMPLQDGSELRILHIGVGEEKRLYAENKISIGVPVNRFGESGKIVSDALAVKNIEIEWQKELHRKNYIQWPKQFRDKTYRDTEPMDHTKAIEAKLQVLSYTYWMSETLNNNRYPNQKYTKIRKAFSDNGYENIAHRIKPFNSFLNNYYRSNKLCEVYYNNWYTAFLESYGEEVDLGTAMFLTSEEYDSEFLMKCTNWLRWIYNELRILEATATEEIETKEEDYRNIKHNLNSLVSANNFWIQRKVSSKLNQTDKEILSYISESMFDFINISDASSETSTQTINVNDEVTLMIKTFSVLCEDNYTYSKIFRKHIDERFFNKHKHLTFLKTDIIDRVVEGNLQMFRLMLKDFIENLIIHSDLGNPNCTIRLYEKDNGCCLSFSNSKWPREEIFHKMKNNSFSLDKTGWRSINRCIQKLKGWRLLFPEYNKELNKSFTIEVLIPNGND